MRNKFLIYDNELVNCSNCKSTKVIKCGTRRNNYSVSQRFRCKDCNTKFMTESLFNRFRYPIEIIKFALNKIDKGDSYSNVSKKIKNKFKLSIPRKTIWDWHKHFREHKIINHKERTSINIKLIKKMDKTLYRREELSNEIMLPEKRHLDRTNPLFRMGLISSIDNGFYKINKEVLMTQ